LPPPAERLAREVEALDRPLLRDERRVPRRREAAVEPVVARVARDARAADDQKHEDGRGQRERPEPSSQEAYQRLEGQVAPVIGWELLTPGCARLTVRERAVRPWPQPGMTVGRGCPAHC